MMRQKKHVDFKELGAPTKEQIEEELERERRKNEYEHLLRNTIFILLVVAAATVLVAVLLLPVVQIDGTSMTKTLQNGDLVVAARGSRYEVGDVIAFYYDNSILVKRVIALEGDWVDIEEDGSVYINGQILEESYVDEKDFGRCDIELPCQVPKGEIFVMGDHRSVSIDSRNKSVGCIKKEQVAGKILFRIWPLKNISFIK